MVFLLGTFLNKRTASDPSNQGQRQQPPFYQQQAQQQAQMQVQSRDKQRDDKQRSNWFPENWYSDKGNNSSTNGGVQKEKSYYSSYGDYDHALDQRTKQVYNESHEKNQTNQHYK